MIEKVNSFVPVVTSAGVSLAGIMSRLSITNVSPIMTEMVPGLGMVGGMVQFCIGFVNACKACVILFGSNKTSIEASLRTEMTDDEVFQSDSNEYGKPYTGDEVTENCLKKGVTSEMITMCSGMWTMCSALPQLIGSYEALQMFRVGMEWSAFMTFMGLGCALTCSLNCIGALIKLESDDPLKQDQAKKEVLLNACKMVGYGLVAAGLPIIGFAFIAATALYEAYELHDSCREVEEVREVPLSCSSSPYSLRDLR